MTVWTMMVVLFVMFVVMVMLFFFFFIIVLLFMMVLMSFYLAYPSGRCGHTVEVKHFGVEELFQLHIAIVALDDFGLWLQCAHYLL